MFDIGWSEILVIIVVAIVVVGPKELPRLMGTFGRYAGKLRRAAAEFQRQFDDAIRDTEMAEVKKVMESVRAETAAQACRFDQAEERKPQTDHEACGAAA